MRVLSTTCDQCGEKQRFQKMYLVNAGPFYFRFCKHCAHSSEEALKLARYRLMSSRPKTPGVPQR